MRAHIYFFLVQKLSWFLLLNDWSYALQKTSLRMLNHPRHPRCNPLEPVIWSSIQTVLFSLPILCVYEMIAFMFCSYDFGWMWNSRWYFHCIYSTFVMNIAEPCWLWCGLESLSHKMDRDSLFSAPLQILYFYKTLWRFNFVKRCLCESFGPDSFNTNAAASTHHFPFHQQLQYLARLMLLMWFNGSLSYNEWVKAHRGRVGIWDRSVTLILNKPSIHIVCATSTDEEIWTHEPRWN